MAGRQSYMHRQERDDDSINWGQVALVFVAFAFIYFVTAFYFSTTSFGKEVRLKGRYDQTEKAWIFGPVSTRERNQVVEINVYDGSVKESWSYFEAELVQDEKGPALLSFGGESWHETGRDSDGYWAAAERNNDIRVTIPDPGRYLLRIRVEGGHKTGRNIGDHTARSKLMVSGRFVRGSTALFIWSGVLLLIVGVVMNELRNRTVINMLSNLSDD